MKRCSAETPASANGRAEWGAVAPAPCRIARVHSVQSMGTLDGPGVRYVLFLQGCPLRCVFCHNPDTWAFDAGTETDAASVFADLLRYRAYFGRKGGVTLSGGEPLAQADFAAELFGLCREAGIHTALDTSGCLWNDAAAALLEVTDLCLLDIKMTTERDYRAHVGCGLSAPLRFLGELDRRGVHTWIRCVVVEGINATAEDMRRLAGLTASYRCVEKIELLPFKKLCAEKYRRLDIPFFCEDVPETAEDTLGALRAELDG